MLVDLDSDPIDFYVVPEWWMRNNIHETHQAYLDGTPDGLRRVNPDSHHHRITTERVSQWAGRWDQLRLFGQAQGDTDSPLPPDHDCQAS